MNFNNPSADFGAFLPVHHTNNDDLQNPQHFYTPPITPESNHHPVDAIVTTEQYDNGAYNNEFDENPFAQPPQWPSSTPTSTFSRRRRISNASQGTDTSAATVARLPPGISPPPVVTIQPLAGSSSNNSTMNPHTQFHDNASALSAAASRGGGPPGGGTVDFVPLSEFDATSQNFNGAAGMGPTTQHFVKGHGWFLSRKVLLIGAVIIAALIITIIGLAIGLGKRGSAPPPSPVTVVVNNKSAESTTLRDNLLPSADYVAREQQQSETTTTDATTTTTMGETYREPRVLINTRVDSPSSDGPSSTTTTEAAIDQTLDRLLSAPIWYLPPDNSTTQSPNASALGVAPTPTPLDNINTPDNKSLRLPQTFVPKHYNVFLQAVMQTDPVENFTFSGTVEIDMVSTGNDSLLSDQLVLHAKGLTINKEDITVMSIANNEYNANPQQVQVVNMTTDPLRDFLILQLASRVLPNTAYRAKLSFAGNLTTSLVGVYLTSYNSTEADGTNKTHWMMASQMETTNARRVFPMFDEPALKATFNVTMVHDKHLTALSNMPNSQPSEPHPTIPDAVIDYFLPTPPMSTYLLAFVLTDFPHIEQNTTSGKLLRVWAQPSLLENARFALKLSAELLDYYENYYQMQYPLKILDQVAVPDMYTTGMENWGLILYQEASIIYDENVNAASQRKDVIGNLAHNIAHQWFGNLVSPAWWDDLWLNEGFATYVQHVGGNKVRPQWHYMNDFLVDEMQDAMEKDSLRSSHAVRVPVYKPDEIGEAFDDITYGKGSTMLRMMRHFLGEKIFSAGVNAYLRQYAYSSATQDDLWDVMSKTARDMSYYQADVKTVMNSWTTKPGLPVVHVLRRNSTSGEPTIRLSQERFLLVDNATIGDWSSGNPVWHIPLTLLTQTGETPLEDMSTVYNYSAYALDGHAQTVWMTEPTSEKSNLKILFWFFDFRGRTQCQLLETVNNEILLFHETTVLLTKANGASSIPATSKHWLLANVLQSGYFRVNYDLNNWHLLLGQLERSPQVIHVANRAQLVDDAFNLARAGYLPSYDIPLGMVRMYLPDEPDYLPWQAVMNNLVHIDFMLRSTSDYDALRDLMLRVLIPISTRLDLWNITRSAASAKKADNDTAPVIPDLPKLKLQQLIYQAACFFDMNECVTHAKQLFNMWMVQYDGSKAANANLTAANPIPLDFKLPIYTTAIRLGGVAEWDFAWEQFTLTNDPLEQNTLLNAMAATREPWLLRRYLRMAIDEQQIKRTSVLTVLSAVAVNSETGQKLAWKIFVDEWESIRDRFASQPQTMADAVNNMLASVNRLEDYEEVKKFVNDNRAELGTAKQSFEQNLELIQSNVDWMRDSKDKIVLWLQLASAFSQLVAVRVSAA